MGPGSASEGTRSVAGGSAPSAGLTSTRLLASACVYIKSRSTHQ